MGPQNGIQYGPFALPQNGLPIRLFLKSQEDIEKSIRWYIISNNNSLTHSLTHSSHYNWREKEKKDLLLLDDGDDNDGRMSSRMISSSTFIHKIRSIIEIAMKWKKRKGGFCLKIDKLIKLFAFLQVLDKFCSHRIQEKANCI